MPITALIRRLATRTTAQRRPLILLAGAAAAGLTIGAFVMPAPAEVPRLPPARLKAMATDIVEGVIVRVETTEERSLHDDDMTIVSRTATKVDVRIVRSPQGSLAPGSTVRFKIWNRSRTPNLQPGSNGYHLPRDMTPGATIRVYLDAPDSNRHGVQSTPALRVPLFPNGIELIDAAPKRDTWGFRADDPRRSSD